MKFFVVFIQIACIVNLTLDYAEKISKGDTAPLGGPLLPQPHYI